MDNQIAEAWDRLGNKSAVARELGVSEKTVRRRLKKMGIDGRPMAEGRIPYIEPNVMPLPPKGKTRRYILTAAQNNTHLHTRFWDNLIAYANVLEAKLMVARFTYDKARYTSARAIKPGSEPSKDDLDDAWWDPELDPYICDDPARHGSRRYELAPGLHWCAEVNILPTIQNPLNGWENYTERSSGIFPHAKICLESVASGNRQATKFNYTTGCVTQRNYIAKGAGLKAAFHHAFGALLVEVNSEGSWWCRQLNAENRGKFYDCPDIGEGGAVCVRDGEVEGGHTLEAINWGDLHGSEMDPEVEEANWGEGGILDVLSPRFQFLHDWLSFRNRSHHEMKKFGRMYEKHVNGQESVEDEVDVTARQAWRIHRDWCKTKVVSSNHDRHGERWLDEADFKKDLLNAEFYLEAQLARVRAIKAGENWTFFEWSMRRAGIPDDIDFLPQDESFVICKKHGGIECGMHGDEGPDGARGNTSNLSKLGVRVNKGHDHKATIRAGVYSAGVCQLQMPYNTGPSSWSISHILTYPNGKRQIITWWRGRWRA